VAPHFFAAPQLEFFEQWSQNGDVKDRKKGFIKHFSFRDCRALSSTSTNNSSVSF